MPPTFQDSMSGLAAEGGEDAAEGEVRPQRGDDGGRDADDDVRRGAEGGGPRPRGWPGGGRGERRVPRWVRGAEEEGHRGGGRVSCSASRSL